MKAFLFRSVGEIGLWALAFGAVFVFPQGLQAVPLKGANGKVVDFAEIVSAAPQGLSVRVQADGEVIEVAWEKLDLADLENTQPDIFAAYQKALQGETTTFDLPPEPKPMEVEENAKPELSPGRYEVTLGDATIAVQMPEGSPKGLFLLSWGQDGNAIRYMGSSREATHFRSVLEKDKFALVSYKFPDVGKGATKMLPPYVFAEKGSGKAVMDGIEKIGQEAGEKDLSKLPMVIYGLDIPGAAFAFNFTHLYPERIVATVAAKGAFYTASPTPESMKVPILLVWGEYDQDPDLWKATHTLPEVMEKFLPEKPLWINAREPRTPRGETLELSHFVSLFLAKMIAERLSAEGEIRELDRSKSWVGDLSAFEVSAIGDPAAPVKEGQTWLPNEDFAKLWKEFTTGTMTIPDA